MTKKSAARVARINQPTGGDGATALATRVTAPAVNGATFQADFSHLQRPLRTLAADCAVARRRHGCVELIFGALNPFSEAELIRVLVARFDSVPFRDRDRLNNEVHETLLRYAAGQGHEIGSFSSLLDRAKLTGQAATVDADGEIISYVGGSSAMIILTANKFEMTNAIQGRRDSFEYVAEVEVTMPTLVLADLVASWKAFVEDIQ